MKCTFCQQQLLYSQETELPEAVAAHLADCAACRQWHQRLLQIESNVSQLPVPVSPARDVFMQEFVQGTNLTTTLARRRTVAEPSPKESRAKKQRSKAGKKK